MRPNKPNPQRPQCKASAASVCLISASVHSIQWMRLSLYNWKSVLAECDQNKLICKYLWKSAGTQHTISMKQLYRLIFFESMDIILVYSFRTQSCKAVSNHCKPDYWVEVALLKQSKRKCNFNNLVNLKDTEVSISPWRLTLSIRPNSSCRNWQEEEQERNKQGGRKKDRIAEEKGDKGNQC